MIKLDYIKDHERAEPNTITKASEQRKQAIQRTPKRNPETKSKKQSQHKQTIQDPPKTNKEDKKNQANLEKESPRLSLKRRELMKDGGKDHHCVE